MSNEQKVGLFFVVGIGLVLLAIEVTAGSGLLRHGYHLTVDYPTVEGLRKGDEVHVAGVKLGRVDQVQLQPDRVHVTLWLENGAVVHRDSIARLDYQALSGTRFIAISLGSPHDPVLHDGDTLEGRVPPGITQMVDQLQGVAVSVQQLAESLNQNQERVLTNVNALIEENRTALLHALDNLDSITGKLDRGAGTLAKLLNDPALYDRATALLTDLQHVADRLTRGEGDLGRLVSGDGALYDEARETIARLHTTATNLEEISTQIRDGEGTIGRMVTDDQLYQDAQQAVHHLDRATAAVEDQSPITVLGTLITTLF